MPDMFPISSSESGRLPGNLLEGAVMKYHICGKGVLAGNLSPQRAQFLPEVHTYILRIRGNTPHPLAPLNLRTFLVRAFYCRCYVFTQLKRFFAPEDRSAFGSQLESTFTLQTRCYHSCCRQLSEDRFPLGLSEFLSYAEGTHLVMTETANPLRLFTQKDIDEIGSSETLSCPEDA